MRRGCDQPKSVFAQLGNDLGEFHLYDREPKDRSRGRPYHLRVKSADGPVSEEHSGSAERLGRAQDRPQIARVLHSSERQKWTGLSFLQQDLQRALTPLHQRCDTLGRLAGDRMSVSTCAPICGSRRSVFTIAASLKNTARNRSPLRMASSTIRRPSIAQYPSFVSSPLWNARRSSFNNELCRLSMRRRRSREGEAAGLKAAFFFTSAKLDQHTTLVWVVSGHHHGLARLAALLHVMVGFAIPRQPWKET